MTKTKKKAAVKKPAVKRKKVDRTPKEGMYKGILYESFCELSCVYFAEELMKGGYVTSISRGPSYVLCEPVVVSYAEQLKRGSKQVTQTVANGVTYTYDYDIFFTQKAIGLFCWVLGSGVKWDKNLLVAQPVGPGVYKASIEVKPDFERTHSTPKSVQSMKWLFQKHGVFVNLFRPNRIFEGLFVPALYRLTETGGQRKFKFQPKSLEQYLHLKKQTK